MKKKMFPIAVAACLSVTSGLWAAEKHLPVDDVNVFIGTGGHGHTYPGASAPFGAVQLSPDTPLKGWDGCSGYHYSDSKIVGFSHTHLSGTGCGDLGDILLLPTTGNLQTGKDYQPLDAEKLASKFSHDNETASPGYYRVQLDRYGITAELTATAHAGMHRYTFPQGQAGHVVVDMVRSIACKVKDAQLTVENDHRISGFRTTEGWANPRSIYFVIESSRPFTGSALEAEDKRLSGGAKDAKGKNVRAALDFAAGEPVVLRVGISGVSVEQAAKNLAAEVTSFDFDAVRTAVRDNWNENLSRLAIQSPSDEIRRTFYTAAYHSMLAPTLFNDADGTYRGPDGNVHQGNGLQYYSTFSLWDTFRAEHPLLTLTQPERVNDFVGSALAFYQQSPDHALPMWPLASRETRCMIGYHAVPMIYDAYAKGFRNYDAKLALKAMTDTALHSYACPADYDTIGYIPFVADKHHQAAARTLEYSFDDWCISQMAKAVGDSDVASHFEKRSQFFNNVFDSDSLFFRGKTKDGKWAEPFDPKAIDFANFTEANAWQYAFFVLHDVPALAKLYGGADVLIRKIDESFDQDSDIHKHLVDVTGLIGQYSHGNEPGHHTAYLYALLGDQDKTARRARQIMRTQYDDAPDGLAGNDDCGQMSAWYVFSTVGLYPLNPSSGVYVIGSPTVEKATLKLDPKFSTGGTFTIVANKVSSQFQYVQAAKLNGQPLSRPWITHDEIMKGGTLELEMGILPKKLWGGIGAPGLPSTGYHVTVDCTQVPDLQPVADRVQKTANEWYPKIVKMMRTDGTAAPHEVKITFVDNKDGVAWCSGDQITGTAKWFRAHPDDIGAFVHELTHVGQGYSKPGTPGWFTEGFADYVRWFIYEPTSKQPKPNPEKSTYHDNYRTSAAFLNWVGKQYGQDVLFKLDRDCRAGAYTDAKWETYTHKQLPDLGQAWLDSLKPAASKPSN